LLPESVNRISAELLRRRRQAAAAAADTRAAAAALQMLFGTGLHLLAACKC